MASNRGVAYIKPGVVEIQSIDFPKLINPTNNKKAEHGVILKIVSTNICGSDQHMVRGRTTAPAGLILRHEITGEVIEAGRDVEFIKKGDIVSVPFNIACGRCRNCKEGKTGICLNVNPSRPGAAYGYVDMGGWVGGQAEYVLVPYADFNLLKFQDKAQAMEKIKDLTLLSDIFPTGYHATELADIRPGESVVVYGAGPVGLMAAYSAIIRGARKVMVVDRHLDRLRRILEPGELHHDPVRLLLEDDRLADPDFLRPATREVELEHATGVVGPVIGTHAGPRVIGVTFQVVP